MIPKRLMWALKHTPGHQVRHGLRQCLLAVLQAHQMIQRAHQQHGLISVRADCLQVARLPAPGAPSRPTLTPEGGRGDAPAVSRTCPQR